MHSNPSISDALFEEVVVPVKLVSDRASVPEYAHPGDGGVDLRSTESLVLEPHERACIGTGIAAAIPRGYAGFVVPRSGLAAKHGISIVNAPGLVDSTYRGEIKVTLVNLDPREPFAIECGDRIAQLVVMRVPTISFEPAESLDETERGTAGFGSTGVS